MFLAKSIQSSNPSLSSADAQKTAGELAKGIMQGGDKLTQALQSVLSSGIKIDGLNGSSKGSDLIAMTTTSAGNLAGAMVGGKTVSDITSVDIANKRYSEKGGFIGLQEDSAILKTQQGIGSTKGQNLVAGNTKGQQEMINKILDTAKTPQERQGMLKDLEKSGWVDSQGNVQPESFIEAKSMLGANNMMSVNSMGIGGKIISGTIGGTGSNTTVKVDGQDSDASGRKLDTGTEMKFFDNMARATLGSGASPKEVKDYANILQSFTGVEDYGLSKKGALAGINNGALAVMKMYDEKNGTGFYAKTKSAMQDDNVGSFVADSLGDYGKVAGSVVGAELLHKAVGGKGTLVGKAFKGTVNSGARLVGSREPFPNPPKNSVDKTNSTNDGKTNSSVNNEGGKHINTPEENLKYSKDQVNKSRESIANYTEEINKEQAKQNPNQNLHPCRSISTL